MGALIRVFRRSAHGDCTHPSWNKKNGVDGGRSMKTAEPHQRQNGGREERHCGFQLTSPVVAYNTMPVLYFAET